MNVEKMAWAALSGAVLCVFWPWMVAQKMAALTAPAECSDSPDETAKQ